MNRLLICLLLLSYISVLGQNLKENKSNPKLVVGIVIDQMRQEYLHRFSSGFGNDGFRRLMQRGFVFENTHYNYAPTFTGPGHASIYTGTTPSIHGIIGNDYYNRKLKRLVNCVMDSTQKAIGNSEAYGKISPVELLTTTITDELKLLTNMKSKVISLSMKDRGAVLSGGHLADAAYWYDNYSGNFITSSYYMKALPEWVKEFNAQNLPDLYLSKNWNLFHVKDLYSSIDSSRYENKFKGKSDTIFPYDLNELRKTNGNYSTLLFTPFSNDYLTEFAKRALQKENLGKGSITDFLCISYSTSDILGHFLGPRSLELEDMYMRLDRNIADLLKELDKTVGKNNYIIFVTADHGAAEVPQYLVDHKIPAGYFNVHYSQTLLMDTLESIHPGCHLIENISNEQIFLSEEVSVWDMNKLCDRVGAFIANQKGVSNYFTRNEIRLGAYDEGGIKGMIIRGFHSERSGDVVFVLEPGWFSANKIQGTTHGSPYNYDTHVPLIFYGHGIKRGSSVQHHEITSIAPTLSMMLNIPFPNGNSGIPLYELFK